MKKEPKLQIKDLAKKTKATTALSEEQIRLIVGGARCEGGTSSASADTDQ